MEKSDNILNLDGLAIGVERMAEIANNSSGLTFIVQGTFGSLSLNILNLSENFGYLPEILYLILRLQKGGNISVKVDSS